MQGKTIMAALVAVSALLAAGSVAAVSNPSMPYSETVNVTNDTAAIEVVAENISSGTTDTPARIANVTVFGVNPDDATTELRAGDTLIAKARLGDDRDFELATVFETTLDHSVDSYGDLWENGLVFKWSDRMDALEADLYLQQYGSQFTLGAPAPEKAIEERVEKTLEKIRTTEASASCGAHVDLESAPVKTLDIEYQRCRNCNYPISLIIDGNTHIGDEILNVEWISSPPGETLGDEFSVIGISQSSPRRDKLALHFASWLGRWETADFDVYIGERDGLLLERAGRIIGYLIWDIYPTGTPILHQVYIQPEDRGAGIANMLLDYWYDNHIQEGFYYALRPNNNGEELLRDAGHIADPGNSLAVPITSMNVTDEAFTHDNMAPEEAERIEPGATIEDRMG
jgi:GNAT superfamily N-acetyltransferase